MENFIFCAVFPVHDGKSLQFEITTDSDEIFFEIRNIGRRVDGVNIKNY